jgi:hypothetical protein
MSRTSRTPGGMLTRYFLSSRRRPWPPHVGHGAETGSVEETLAAARARPVEPVLPKVAIRDGAPQVLLPGEPGYDDA